MAKKNIMIKNTVASTGKSLISSAQGGLYHNGIIYQFANGGPCKMYDTSFTQVGSFSLPKYKDNTSVSPHCSSVEWVKPGEKIALTTNQAALVDYADRVYIYDITDKSNITQEIVMLDGCDKYKYEYMAAMCYNKDSNMMYLAGYELRGHNVNSKLWLEKYDFSDYANGVVGEDGYYHATLVKQTTTTGVGKHLQDGNFHNGYLYYFWDNNRSIAGSYNGLGVWIFDEEFNHVGSINVDSTNTKEGEAFYIIDDNPSGLILGMGLMKNTYTVYHTQISPLGESNSIKLSSTLNVIGYNVDGVISLGDGVVSGAGSHVVMPILRDDAEWYEWSDGVTDMERVFEINDTTEYEVYSARGYILNVEMVPVPSSLSTERTSALANSTGISLKFNVSSDSNAGEYSLCSSGKYNDLDLDITTIPNPSTASKISEFFTREGITDDMYYFSEIPNGTTSFDVAFTVDDSYTFAANTRNPWVCIVSGDNLDNLYKNRGVGVTSDDDIYRPLAQSFTINLNNVRFKSGYRTVELGALNYLLVRGKGLGNSMKANITFHRG